MSDNLSTSSLSGDNKTLGKTVVAVSNQIDKSQKKNRTLHNKLDKKSLLAKLESETEPRVTISLYRYQNLSNLPVYRAELYKEWEDLGFLEEYIAEEGIKRSV